MQFKTLATLLFSAVAVSAQAGPLTSFTPPCAQACVRMAIEGTNHAGTGSSGAVDCTLSDVPCLCEASNKDAIAEESIECATAGCGAEIGATAGQKRRRREEEEEEEEEEEKEREWTGPFSDGAKREMVC
ncbi:hypothetical protein MKZ38_003361 [Zalerion maritima]|uniref:Extracellular membrane protein CFEM domain-containing protein n=1 Tax=Zalerion maritima TaxID=339359 RepID=A0AAD5RP01_9PEZI|nr:hypothetical protein MKZ38_003361 [Zalerion maritima]